jgi:hypothetical protein
LIATSPGNDLKSAKIASDDTGIFSFPIAVRAKGIVPMAAVAPVKNPRRELTIVSPNLDPDFSDVLFL